MIHYLRPLSVTFLLFALAGCLDISREDKQVLANGEQPIANCFRPPLVALAREPLPREFSLTVWNIYKGKKPNWQAGLDAHAKGQDLLMLQETTDAPAMRNWLQHNAYQWRQMQAFKQEGISYGVMTAAKSLDAFSCGVRTPEPLLRIPKSGLVSLYPLAEDPDGLLVINLHAINFSFSMARFRQQLYDLTELMRIHQGPVIMAGDFNSWSEKRTRWLEGFVNELGLKQAKMSPDQRLRVSDYPLDHIFYRSLKLLEANSPASDASDHAPITARFRALHTVPKAFR
ncbi:MAG: endonuclease/exonuclease/phosphatase family protein [Aeromonas sp.]